MCYHVSINRKDKEYLENTFDADLRLEFPTNYHHVNGFQRPEMMIITQQEPNRIQTGIWSVAPPDCHDVNKYWKEKGGSALNTRDDSLFSFKSAEWKSEAVLSQKCLVLVTGFFEPHKVNKISYPYLLHRPDNEVFALVGYYTEQHDGSKTFAVLTTEANDFMERVHNIAKRMPMTLLPEDKEALFALDTEAELRKEFSLRYSVSLEAKAVHRDILNARIDTDSEGYLSEVYHPILTDF